MPDATSEPEHDLGHDRDRYDDECHGVVACLFGVDDAPNRLLQRGNTCSQDDDGNFALTPRPKPSKGFSAASAVTV